MTLKFFGKVILVHVLRLNYISGIIMKDNGVTEKVCLDKTGSWITGLEIEMVI